MRFYLGEVYEGEFDVGLRLALVVGLADQGQRATLRFIDAPEALILHWTDLKDQKWRRLDEA
jgi:hypothetical protein